MAEIHLKSGHRLHVYRCLFRLNLAFTHVTGVLSDFEDIEGIFNPARLKELRHMSREFQCEINHYLLSTLLPLEDEDWFEFGKASIAREHWLNPERPAFKKQ